MFWWNSVELWNKSILDWEGDIRFGSSSQGGWLSQTCHSRGCEKCLHTPRNVDVGGNRTFLVRASYLEIYNEECRGWRDQGQRSCCCCWVVFGGLAAHSVLHQVVCCCSVWLCPFPVRPGPRKTRRWQTNTNDPGYWGLWDWGLVYFINLDILFFQT